MGTSVGSGLKDVFSTGDDNVNGTGQNVQQLKDLGYSKDDIGQLGTTPDKGVGAARGILKGALGGLGQGLQNQQKKQNSYSGFYGY